VRVYAGAVLAVAVLAAGGWRIEARRESGGRLAMYRRRIPDTVTLRALAGLLIEDGFPMKDGALDPYALARRKKLMPDMYSDLRSERFGGPTDEEIESGSYTNFPWERYRGPPPDTRTRVPLLWERAPDVDGHLLVALSDGSVEKWEPGQLERALGRSHDGR
jgi:hypothetical protein